MALHALFFDFDGLICDTENAARRAWEELYAAHGLVFPEEVWAGMTGRSNGEDFAVNDLAQRLGRPVTGEERSRRRHRKQELADQEPLRAGVAELIAAAAAMGMRLAVVSSSPGEWVEHHLVRLGVYRQFDLLVTGDTEADHKPAPDLYLRALYQTGARPERVLAFEDSPSGVRAAQSAGLRCIAVASAANPFADLAAADLVLDSLTAFRFVDVPPTPEGMITG